MGSLQEQLLQAGLANKQKAKEIRAQKKKQLKQKKTPDQSTLQQKINVAKNSKQEKDKQLNLQIEEKRKVKEQQAIVADIINVYKIKNYQDGAYFNFSYQNKIEAFNTNEKLRKQLIQGELGVVDWQDDFILLPQKVITKIEKIITDKVAYQVEITNLQADSVVEDDFYSQFNIPDDLIW